MKIVENTIFLDDLKQLAEERFGDLVKAVVDIEKEIMVAGGEYHADCEALLLDNGSVQNYLWGINIFPDLPREQWLEFDSVINIRPSQGNRSRNVDDPAIREKIIHVVNKLTAWEK